MTTPIRLPTRRARIDLADRPLSECLEVWADDLRRRGLVTEASYLDAARLCIRLYEDERGGGAIAPAQADAPAPAAG